MTSLAKRATATVPLLVLTTDAYSVWLKQQSLFLRNSLADFRAEPGTHRHLLDQDGKQAQVLAITHAPAQLWDLAALPFALPNATYRIVTPLTAKDATQLALGWELGAYQFTRYKKPERAPARLIWPEKADHAEVTAIASAITLGRDLINTPAEDMGPAELAAEVVAVGKKYSAKTSVIVGEALLKQNFPLIHAVGRASTRAPRLVDLRWGHAKHRRVTLVGKGVCFDTGGLDIKSSSGMYLMKKDMGGAATALALAAMIMALKLPIQLRLLIPAVENSISGNAFRPSDIFTARNGLSVEIGNTDAEGRLILADALALAMEDKPEILLDFATLTGAARVALGTELPALFCNDDRLAEALLVAGKAQLDPLWRLPLHQEYKADLKTKIADLNSAPNSGYAGAITAALFLENFIGQTSWAHIDMMGWHLAAKPGRPVGGEPMTARAVLALLRDDVKTTAKR